MRSCLTLAERDRRWAALQAAMRRAGYAALLFVANDHRGHKGTLRYVADFNLYHRFGYAVMPADREPVLVLPTILADVARSGWVGDHRFAARPIAAVADLLRALPPGARIGVVGRDQIMRAGDHLALVAALPEIAIEDASALFDSVRLRKSAEEIAGIEEAAAIADRCLATLLDVARPGETERAIGARMLEVCARIGGEDPLFLTMHPMMDNGIARPRLTPPGSHEIGPRGTLIFSFEMIGPSGYWTELCRMIAFGRPTAALTDSVDIGIAAIEAGRRAMRPGKPLSAIQQATATAIPAAYDLSAWSGHSIGQDVLEEPFIGPAATDDNEPLMVDSMALAYHPMFVARDGSDLFYMADIYLVGAAETKRCSGIALQLFTRTGAVRAG
jgi:Xaa-Pro aminopeptidase